MTETPAEQRAHLLEADPETEPWEYDLALALGYTPESWTGMWRLTVHPFTFINGYVIIREVVSNAAGRAHIVRGDRVSYRVRTVDARLLTTRAIV